MLPQIWRPSRETHDATGGQVEPLLNKRQTSHAGSGATGARTADPTRFPPDSVPAPDEFGWLPLDHATLETESIVLELGGSGLTAHLRPDNGDGTKPT
jgi:hypothetical protein